MKTHINTLFLLHYKVLFAGKKSPTKLIRAYSSKKEGKQHLKLLRRAMCLTHNCPEQREYLPNNSRFASPKVKLTKVKTFSITTRIA